MKRNNFRNNSYYYSVAIHLLLIILLSLINFNYEPEIDEYVTIGFGPSGTQSSSGILGEQKEIKEVVKNEEKKVDDKDIELPQTVNKDEKNVITQVDDKKEDKPVEKEEPSNVGQESEGDDIGNFGFEIDFGGGGKRRIYSSPLPEYPEGVSKEIDIKLRFSISPDGTVGKIIPLIKADTRLEMAAIYSLRQWRFEPLPARVKQGEQTAIIVFPYRLR